MAISWYQFRFQKVTDDNISWQSADFFDANKTATSPAGTYCNATMCFNRLPNAGAQTTGAVTGNMWDGRNNTQGFSNGAQQKHIGDEIDIDFTWKHSDNVSFQAGMASFRPGKYIQSMIADSYNGTTSAGLAANPTTTTSPGMRVSNNPVVMAYGDMKIKF